MGCKIKWIASLLLLTHVLHAGMVHADYTFNAYRLDKNNYRLHLWHTKEGPVKALHYIIHNVDYPEFTLSVKSNEPIVSFFIDNKIVPFNQVRVQKNEWSVSSGVFQHLSREADNWHLTLLFKNSTYQRPQVILLSDKKYVEMLYTEDVVNESDLYKQFHKAKIQFLTHRNQYTLALLFVMLLFLVAQQYKSILIISPFTRWLNIKSRTYNFIQSTFFSEIIIILGFNILIFAIIYTLQNSDSDSSNNIFEIFDFSNPLNQVYVLMHIRLIHTWILNKIFRFGVINKELIKEMLYSILIVAICILIVRLIHSFLYIITDIRYFISWPFFVLFVATLALIKEVFVAFRLGLKPNMFTIAYICGVIIIPYLIVVKILT